MITMPKNADSRPLKDEPIPEVVHVGRGLAGAINPCVSIEFDTGAKVQFITSPEGEGVSRLWYHPDDPTDFEMMEAVSTNRDFRDKALDWLEAYMDFQQANDWDALLEFSDRRHMAILCGR